MQCSGCSLTLVVLHLCAASLLGTLLRGVLVHAFACYDRGLGQCLVRRRRGLRHAVCVTCVRPTISYAKHVSRRDVTTSRRHDRRSRGAPRRSDSSETPLPLQSLDDGALFVTLAPNLLGSFIMGLLAAPALAGVTPDARIGVVAWPPRRRQKQLTRLHLGCRTGFCGSLTSWASWNQEMVLRASPHVGAGTKLAATDSCSSVAVRPTHPSCRSSVQARRR